MSSVDTVFTQSCYDAWLLGWADPLASSERASLSRNVQRATLLLVGLLLVGPFVSYTQFTPLNSLTTTTTAEGVYMKV